MGKFKFRNNVHIVARKIKDLHGRRRLDYFFLLPNGETVYAFSRNYSALCYERYKSRVPLNMLLTDRQNNRAVMNLVKYLKYMLPYLVEYYDMGRWMQGCKQKLESIA